MKKFDIASQGLSVLMMSHEDQQRTSREPLRGAGQRGHCAEPSPVPVISFLANPAVQPRAKVGKIDNRIEERRCGVELRSIFGNRLLLGGLCLQNLCFGQLWYRGLCAVRL